MGNQVTHILFDFFGTLVDYSATFINRDYARTHAVLLAHGATVERTAFCRQWEVVWDMFETRAVATCKEYSMDDVVGTFLSEIFGGGAPLEAHAAFRDTFLEEWDQNVVYIDGVPGLLESLSQRYTLALVSNTHRASVVKAHLRRMHVEQFFTAVVTSIEFGRRKPDPSIFRHALHATSGCAEAAVYVGDSFAADYVGAASAGIRCLLLDPSQRHPIPKECRLSHILEMPQAVERIAVG